jgi:hypothetical protein
VWEVSRTRSSRLLSTAAATETTRRAPAYGEEVLPTSGRSAGLPPCIAASLTKIVGCREESAQTESAHFRKITSATSAFLRQVDDPAQLPVGA